MQTGIRNIMGFQITVNFLFGTRSAFPHNKRLIQKIRKIQSTKICLFLIFQVMLIHRRGNYQFVRSKRNEAAVRFLESISHKCQIHASVQHPGHGPQAVRLPGMEIDIRNLTGKSTENLRKQIRGRNGGNCQIYNLFIDSSKFFYNIAAHIQNVGSTVIKLKSSLGDGQLLGGADQQPGV